MKKLFINSLLLLNSISPVMAQGFSEPVIVRDSYGCSLMPLELCEDQYLFMWHWNYDVVILDSNIEHFKTINLPEPNVFAAIRFESHYTQGEDSATPVSQTLFNEDLDFEYLRGITEAGTPYVTGYEVVSEKGNVLSTITFPQGLKSYVGNVISSSEGRFDECIVFRIDGNDYLTFDVEDPVTDYEYTIFYRIDKSSASIHSVGEPIRVNVTPGAPRKGEAVTVNLGETAATPAVVNLVSAAGQTLMSRNIPAGQSSLSIDTAALPRGLYVVTVDDGRSVRENTKIIIR